MRFNAGFLIVILGAIVAMGTAHAAVHTVDDDWAGADFGTIQGAIDAASEGDTILVNAGWYNESVTVNKTVDLVGNGTHDTYVNASGSGDVLSVSSNWVNMSGFNISGSGGTMGDCGVQFTSVTSGNITGCAVVWNDWGIYIDEGGSIDITDCYLSNNTEGIRVVNADHVDLHGNRVYGSEYEGVSFRSTSAHFTVTGNDISWNNRMRDWNAAGLEIDGSDYGNASQNHISHNARYGIYIHSTSFENELFDNEIVFNCGGVSGVYLSSAPATAISHNNISNSTGEGISVYGGWNVVIRNNTLDGNNHKAGMSGIYVWGSDGILIKGNRVAHGPEAGIFVHHTDGAMVHTNEVLNNSKNGIWLSTSTTNATVVWNVVRRNGVNGILLDGGTNHTWVHNNTVAFNNADMVEYMGGIKAYGSYDFDIDGNTVSNNAYHGIYLDESDNGTVRWNEVVRNCGGRAGLGMRDVAFTHVFRNNISNSTGHGIDAYMIHSCVFHNNTINGNNEAGLRDGGIRFTDCWKNEFKDNEIVNNTGYGFHFEYSENNSMMRNVVSGHSLDGILLDDDSNNVIITDNTVSYNNLDSVNNQGGIRLDNSSWCVLARNTVTNNKMYGVILVNSVADHIESNEIIRNCGGQAGLMLYYADRNEVSANNVSNCTGTGIDVIRSSHNEFHNNTLNGNDMGMSGNSGGVYLYHSHWNEFTDNVVLDNRIQGFKVYNSENCTLTRNDIGRNGGHGILGYGAHNITVTNCSIWRNNPYGIHIWSTWTIHITYNEIWNNSGYGICFESCSLAKAYLNNIVNNSASPQAYDDNNNTWDNGTHGNFWSDYTGPDKDGDGIGEWPYNLTGGAQDIFPLMNMTDNDVPRQVPEFPVVVAATFVGVLFFAEQRRRRRL